MLVYGRVEAVKADEKNATISVKNGRKRTSVVVPLEIYDKEVEKFGQTLQTQEVEIEVKDNGKTYFKIFD